MPKPSLHTSAHLNPASTAFVILMDYALYHIEHPILRWGLLEGQIYKA